MGFVCLEIDYPTSCEIHAVVRYLQAKIWELKKSIVSYAWFTAKTAMSEGSMGQCSAGAQETGAHTFAMKSKVIERPYVVRDDLVQYVVKNCKDRRLEISDFSCTFQRILGATLYQTTGVRLCYHKCWARWGSKYTKGHVKSQITRFNLWMLLPQSSRGALTHIKQPNNFKQSLSA
jgi:hypothetical protein